MPWFGMPLPAYVPTWPRTYLRDISDIDARVELVDLVARRVLVARRWICSLVGRFRLRLLVLELVRPGALGSGARSPPRCRDVPE